MKRWLLAAGCSPARRATRSANPGTEPHRRSGSRRARDRHASDRLVVIVNYDETATTSDAMSAAIMNVGSG